MGWCLKTVFFFQVVENQFIRQETAGKIINIASILSSQGGIRVPSYTASKSGIKGVTIGVAADITVQLGADEEHSSEILRSYSSLKMGGYQKT